MRMKTYLTLTILAAIAICGACRKSASNQNSNSNTAAPTQETVGGGAAPAGEKFYFRGLISDITIEMTLVRDGERLTGTYLYPRVGKNIDLTGSIDKDGNVDLRESDETGKQTGVFKGKWKSAENGLAEIDGKWSRPDGSKETEFNIWQQPFEFAAARVSSKVIRETNKEARYSVDAEYPQIDGDARFNGFNQQARAMITKDVAAFKTAESQPSDEEETPAETLTSTLSIFYDFTLATDDLISVEFIESEYSRGAAHGNSVTFVLNYDLKNGKKLALADLFNAKSNYLNVISAYCIKDLREQAKKDKESMIDEDMMKTGTEPRADNYQASAITRKGLWITFDPYQVAAYAAGPQHVLVPYSALKDIIKPDGPIGKLAG
jgi:hypothetical protein